MPEPENKAPQNDQSGRQGSGKKSTIPVQQDITSVTIDEINTIWGQTIGLDAREGNTLKQAGTEAFDPWTHVSIGTHSVGQTQQQKPQPSPSVFPDYQLIGVLGEGGMAIVYEAKQSCVDRIIALKFMKGDPGHNKEDRARFLSEAMVTAELDHPNVIPIHEMGFDAGGKLFYSMKRVHGTPWDKVMESRTQAENLEILMAVCNAVAFAHSRGVIHRDLKPSNIMLGEFGEVFVMDWGVAAAIRTDSKAEKLVGIVMGGTPAYMAPEMARGMAEMIGVHSDVYLLGGILYQIICGKKPHRGKSVTDCLVNAANNVIELADKAGELIDIAKKAMSAHPQDRHASVMEFQQAIRDYQAHSQSIALTATAYRDLSAGMSGGDYEKFAQGIFGFRAALDLWPTNVKAGGGLSMASVEYAKTALGRGDLDLAASLLSPQDPGHAELVKAVRKAKHERILRQRRLKAITAVSVVLVVAIIGVLTVSFFWIRSEQTRTESALKGQTEQKNRAENEKSRAENEKNRAVAAEAKARQEESRAKEGEARALKRIQAFEPYSKAMDLLNRGQFLANLSDRGQLLGQSVELFGKSLQIDSDFSEAQYALGEALRLNGLPGQAAQAYLKADELSRKFAGKPNLQALIAAGLAFEDAGLYEKSEKTYLTAMNEGADDPLALVGKVFHMVHYRKLKDAVKVAEQARTLGPHLWETHYAYGYSISEAIGDGVLLPESWSNIAYQSLEKANNMAPYQGIIFFQLITALSQLDVNKIKLNNVDTNKVDAINMFIKRAVDLEPRNPMRYIERGHVFARQGQKDSAINDLKKAKELNAPLFALSNLELRIIGKSEAEKGYSLMKEAIKDCPNWPGFKLNYIIIGISLGKRDEVMALFEQLYRENPDYHAIKWVKGALFASDGNVDAAIAEFQAGLKEAPYNRRLLTAISPCLIKKERFAEYLDVVDAIIKISPNEFKNHVERLNLLVRLKRFDDVERSISELEKKFPDKAAELAELRRSIKAN
ncbi:MAG: protein kinase [Planctomycetes bacterium]|nr:protein kinase [Planctomycetota bacterium]